MNNTKLNFFRKIIANVVIASVVLTVVIFAFVDGKSQAVSVDNTPIYKGESTTNVSLMVNVYWGTEYIDEMLDIFAKNDVKTTFFVGGMWVAENDNTLKKIYNAGHEIGNHGYFHKDHKKISAERNREEINTTHQIVKLILGIEMNLFAPPSGSFSSSTVEGAKALGYKTIMWSNDTIDWRDKDSEIIYNRATKAEAGGLVLMHPTQYTVNALDRIIKTLKAKGLKITPVSQVLKSE